MTESFFILILNAIRGVGYKSIMAVLSSGMEPQKIIDNPELLANYKIRNLPEIIKNLREKKEELFVKAQEHLDTAKSLGAEVISISDSNYPTKLKDSNEPPLLLFCIGDLNLMNKAAVAVIGSRNGCEYGKLIAKSTVEAMGKEGLVIVSGLALGIDTDAHKAAINSSALTIAVLPDIGNIVPKENKDLARKILDSGGLLIAENVPNHRISKGDFIKRDRIQVALSDAIFPIQTSPDGGTMHAVHEAERTKTPIYCPDFSYFIETGKMNSETPEVDGIQELLRSGRAMAYTKSNYAKIANQLKNQSVKNEDQ